MQVGEEKIKRDCPISLPDISTKSMEEFPNHGNKHLSFLLFKRGIIINLLPLDPWGPHPFEQIHFYSEIFYLNIIHNNKIIMGFFYALSMAILAIKHINRMSLLVCLEISGIGL